jgi:photosystem II stability/assembly factor-like uncharacterized protein
MNRRFVAVAVFAITALLALDIGEAGEAVDPKNAAPSSGDEAVSKPHGATQREPADRRVTFIDVSFLTPERGFAAGSGGILFSTVDGGKNWAKRKIGNADLRQIYFQDDRRGWLLTDAGILRTYDAGETWTPSAPPDARAVSRIYFVNPQVGWLLGKNGVIFKTSDGGETWRRQLSGVTNSLRKIACFTVSSCIVAGEKNTILNTSNGGQTWIRRSPATPTFFSTNRVQINAVHVTRAGTAWALAVAYKGGYLLQSSNQGRTWEIASRLLDDYPRLIHFLDDRRGVLLDAIAIMHTEDGGSTWKDGWPGGPVLNSFFFLNDKLAWAVGDFETILHTQDGGRTWVKQHDDGVIPIPHE